MRKGNLANWAIPGKMLKGMGWRDGILVASFAARHCRHGTRYEGRAAENPAQVHPAAHGGLEVVDMIVTELAVIDVTPEGPGAARKSGRPALLRRRSRKFTEPTLRIRGRT